MLQGPFSPQVGLSSWQTSNGRNHTAPVASIPLPVLAGFTFSHPQNMKLGGHSTPTLWNSNTGPAVPDHQMLHMSGVLHFQACCPWRSRRLTLESTCTVCTF